MLPILVIIFIVLLIGLAVNDDEACGDLHVLAKIYYVICFIILAILLIVASFLGAAILLKKKSVDSKKKEENV